jgi:hypothetical protein
MSVVKKRERVYFVEVFLIVSLIFDENVKKIYFGTIESPLVLLLGQGNPIDVQIGVWK